MDRIRKALDLAREERNRTLGGLSVDGEAAPAKQVADFASGTAANAQPPGEIRLERYRTQVFDPDLGLLERNRVLTPSETNGAATAYRMLRTQVLQRMVANGWRTLALFSPGAQDGKTTTAVNLAISLASDPQHSVLLVEFDFRRPTVASRFGFVPQHGAEDVLLGATGVQDCLYHPRNFDRLVIMPARGQVANSSELLACRKSRDTVAELRARYPERIVLFDLPPVLMADDALAFAPLVECGLVVAAEGRTRRKDLARAIELLHRIPLVGTVLNRATDVPAGH